MDLDKVELIVIDLHYMASKEPLASIANRLRDIANSLYEVINYVKPNIEPQS